MLMWRNRFAKVETPTTTVTTVVRRAPAVAARGTQSTSLLPLFASARPDPMSECAIFPLFFRLTHRRSLLLLMSFSDGGDHSENTSYREYAQQRERFYAAPAPEACLASVMPLMICRAPCPNMPLSSLTPPVHCWPKITPR